MKFIFLTLLALTSVTGYSQVITNRLGKLAKIEVSSKSDYQIFLTCNPARTVHARLHEESYTIRAKYKVSLYSENKGHEVSFNISEQACTELTNFENLMNQDPEIKAEFTYDPRSNVLKEVDFHK